VPTTPVHVQERQPLADFLQRDPFLHLYGLGDLDDFYWPRTTWLGLEDAGRLVALALVYRGVKIPTVLALAPRDELAALRDLLGTVRHQLPEQFHAHLSPGVVELYRDDDLTPGGQHLKLALTERSQLVDVDVAAVTRLGARDRKELERLYALAYPENWFDPRMLATGQYFGLRRRGWLVAVGGVHVYSPLYRVAALGNVVTHPEHRGQGLARSVVARLCQSLLETVDHIGLNVAQDNAPARRLYEGLGFSFHARYEEATIRLLPGCAPAVE